MAALAWDIIAVRFLAAVPARFAPVVLSGGGYILALLIASWLKCVCWRRTPVAQVRHARAELNAGKRPRLLAEKGQMDAINELRQAAACSAAIGRAMAFS